MHRKLFLVTILAASVGLFAQSQPVYTSPGIPAEMTQPSSPSVVVVPASPSIYVVGGGFYGTGIYLTTPGTLPVQNTGISLAGREGISLETPLQTGAIMAVPSFSMGGVPINNTAPAYAGSETAVAESGRLINDMGPSYYVSAATAAPPAPSLGEVAANYRSGHPRGGRTFTNADAQRLANTVTITGAGAMENLRPAPLQQNAPAENPPPQAENREPQAIASAPASENPPATKPQVNAEKATPQVLPATSTLLPLLGLLGLVSGGFGLWFGRFRR